MITVHHLDNSRSQRVLWLMEELDLPYEIRHYKRNADTMLAPPELKKIHPLGKSPVIDDGENVVAETGAIIEYILQRHGHGRLAPAPGLSSVLDYTYWLHYAEGSAISPLVLKLVFRTIPSRVPWLVRWLTKAISQGVQDQFVDPQAQTHIDFWEASLAGKRWFLGAEFTAADIAMSFPVESAARVGLLNGRQNCQAWLGHISARPAYRRALERGRAA